MEIIIQKKPLATVIKRPFDADAARASLALGVPVVTDMGVFVDTSWKEDTFVSGTSLDEHEVAMVEIHASDITHTITTLPPLAGKPKPEDAALFYRYLSEGLDIIGQDNKGQMMGFRVAEGYYGWSLDAWHPTHALLADGQRVDVAIEGGEE
nr:hypothetical protein 40 [bacterium]